MNKLVQTWDRLSKVKRLEDAISPLTWIVCYFSCAPMFFLVFNLSAFDYLVFFAVDYMALVLFRAIDKKLFLKLFPEATPFFTDFRTKKFENLDFQEKTNLFKALVQYPVNRARYCLFLSSIKCIPAILIMLFYWKYSVPFGIHVFKIVCVEIIVWTFFHIVFFFESHQFISDKISELHETYDWSDLFRSVKPPFSEIDFEYQERLAVILAWTWSVILQLTLAAYSSSVSKTMFLFQLGAANFSVLIQVSWVWYLSRKFLKQAFLKMFSSIERYDPGHGKVALSLHSSNYLASFEVVVNNLFDRVEEHKRELNLLVSRESERSRFFALGELSALVVHDLSAPLHVMSYCVEYLKDHISDRESKRYISQLEMSQERARELVESLRSYLKNSPFEESISTLSEVHSKVLKLLELRYKAQGFEKIKISIENEALTAKVPMTKSEFIHVLYNLIDNSVKNLLNGCVEDPEIRIYLKKSEDSEIVLALTDNGSGLNREDYETMTERTIRDKSGVLSSRGLGLRLIRRLMESAGAALELIDSPSGSGGTAFHLRFFMGEGNKFERGHA